MGKISPSQICVCDGARDDCEEDEIYVFGFFLISSFTFKQDIQKKHTNNALQLYNLTTI